MTPTTFRRLTKALELNLSDLAYFLDKDLRTVRRWANDQLPIPREVALLLRVLHDYKLDPAEIHHRYQKQEPLR